MFNYLETHKTKIEMDHNHTSHTIKSTHTFTHTKNQSKHRLMGIKVVNNVFAGVCYAINKITQLISLISEIARIGMAV